MNRLVFILFFVFLSSVANSQNDVCKQIPNSDFELWTNLGTRNEEPQHWHSFKTSTGPFHYLLMQQVERHTATRPGSKGKYSAYIFSRSIVGITVNGNITNGRLNAGSMFPSGVKNNNYTQRDSEFCTEITEIPDSLTVWICLRTKEAESYGRLMSYVHGDADFVCFTGGWKPYEMLCAQVEHEFPRTDAKDRNSASDDELVWKRFSIPFKRYPDLCKKPRYILTSFTTNKRAGEGDAGDEMFVDDLHLIYNPSLEIESVKSEASKIEVRYTIKGTMSPPNLNLPSNEVIVEVSSDENFEDSVEIGRIVTDESGSVNCTLPKHLEGKAFYVKVRTTNYPMEKIKKVGRCVKN